MFAILFEALLIENQEEIPHFAGWEGGGLMGTKIVNKIFVNKLAFPKYCSHGQNEYRRLLICLWVHLAPICKAPI